MCNKTVCRHSFVWGVSECCPILLQVKWVVVTWPPDLSPHNTEPHSVSTTVQRGVLTARQATFLVSIEQSRKPHPTNAHLSGRQAAPMHQRGLKTLRGLWTCSTCLVAAEGATFVGSGNQRSWRFFVFFLFCCLCVFPKANVMNWILWLLCLHFQLFSVVSKETPPSVSMLFLHLGPD